jgi:PST family polysaccharide transporter
MIERLKGLVRLQPMRNILALYGVRAIEQLLPLVVLPYLARILGAEGWGLFAMAQAFAMYGIVTVEFGFGFSGTRAVARARDQAARLAELLTGIGVAQLLLAAVVALVAVLARLLVPAFHDQPLLLWAGLAFAVLQGLLPLWYFTGQERIPLIAGIAVAAKALATLAIFALVRGPDDGWLVLACYAGGALLATGAGYALLLREVRPGRLSLKLIGETLRLGAGMFLMRVMVLMHTAGNTFLLGLLVAPQQVAFFAAGEKLCRPIAWLLQPINTALLPRLSHLVERSPDRAQQVAALTVLLQGVVGLALGAVIALMAPWLVDLLFGAEYRAAAEVLRVMAGIIPLVVINAALVSQWLIPHGLDRALNVVIVASAVLNLILALSLAPRFGALGMAWVTVVAEGCIMVGLLWALRRRGLRPLTPDLLRRGFAALPRR